MSVFESYLGYISLHESAWAQAVRLVVPEAYQHLSDDALDCQLESLLHQMTIQEREVVLESLGKIARDLGRGLAPHAGTLGTVGGAALGTALLGPGAGTTIGGALGGAVGGAIGRAAGGQQPAVAPRGSQPGGGAGRPAPVIPPMAPVSPAGTTASPATPVFSPTQEPPAGGRLGVAGIAPSASSNQLLILINNPNFLVQILRAILHNAAGRQQRTEAADSQDDILEAFGNAISVMAEKMAINSTEMALAYMRSENGLPFGSSEEEAEALFYLFYDQRERLREANNAYSTKAR